MTTVSIAQLETEHGYKIAKMKTVDGQRTATLEKDGRTIVVDDKLLADIAGLAGPIEFPARAEAAA